MTTARASRAGRLARWARFGVVPVAALTVVLATSPGSATSQDPRRGTFAFVTQGNNVAVVQAERRSLDLDARIHLQEESSAIGVAASPNGKLVYVPDFAKSVVHVFKTSNDTPVATIRLAPGTTPVGIAVSRDGKYAYTANSTNNSVSVLDLRTNTREGDDIPVGTSPRGVSVSADGKRVYAANDQSGSVSVIDPKERKVKTIEIGDPEDPDRFPRPRAVALWDARHIGFVTNNGRPSAGGSSVSVIDTKTNTVKTVIHGLANPVGVAFSSRHNLVYTANNGDTTVGVIDAETNRVTDAIDIGCSPIGVSLSPDQKRLFATCAGAGTFTMIDTRSHRVLSSLAVGVPASQSVVVDVP
ncbi:beta-propeller fold lactonase family protein [Streptomyces sp. NPDC086023]|uniref:beta-propeller fold lactonase family protein n=1 Tax=Streptomyces sp. NPDC086023 TaxID=3365746 RepID=UPI0037CF2111